MSKHTPGPWTVHFHDSQEWHITALKGEPRLGHTEWHALAIAYGNDKTPYEGRDIAEANARLIAAAPDLLEACKAAALTLREFARHCHESGWNNLGSEVGKAAIPLEAAIAKAEGQP